MPVRGDTPHDIPPAALAIAEQFLEMRNVPHRNEFRPAHLAEYLGGTKRTWQRRMEHGEIIAVREGRDYVTFWPWLVRYYAARQNVIDMN